MPPFKFHVYFKWLRNEEFEAMNDSALDQLADGLTRAYTSYTTATIRGIAQALADKNDQLANEELKQFMKEDMDGLPRYTRYIQSIVGDGVYLDNPDRDPSRAQAFLDSVVLESDLYGVQIVFEIPDEFRIENWDTDDYLEAMKRFKGSLADGLWEGSEGSIAVHQSLAVVNFDVWSG